MSPAGDEDLRRLFEERRTSGEEKAPPFRGFLERGRSDGTRPARIRLAGLVTAAAAILALAVSLTLFHRRPPLAIPIEEWKAPTDFLLEASYPDLLDTMPAPPEAVPDYSLLLATEKGTTP
jgi:hypothetical protein